ncbi:MAG: hypothetical protein ACM3O4_04835 [Ignavibacteriales bacterium]
MDKETREIYKTVVKDLSGRAVVKVTPARVSFAVANLFKGIRETHHRNVERIKNLGINIAAKAGNMADSINAGFQNLVQNNESKREFVNSFGETDKVQEAIDAKVDAEYAEDVQRKEDLLASIQRDNRLVNAGAGFIIDAYQADVQNLKNRVVTEKSKPHRLLVNKMFLNQFKDAAAAKRIRLRERKKLKIAVAREVRKFDNACREIRKRYADNPAMVLEKIEEERMKLSETALDFVTLREGLGHGVSDKEVWGAYFIGIDEMEVGIPVSEFEPSEPVVEQAAPEVQPVVAEQLIVTPELEPVVAEQQIVTPELQPVEQTVVTPDQNELYGRLANAINVRAESLEQAAPELQPVVTEQQIVTPELQPAAVEQQIVTPELQPAAAEQQIVTPELQPAAKQPIETDVLLGGIDTLRAGYRDELNDGYNYTDTQKKEWEDARLAEDISLKNNNLSYDEQEATVLSYEQGLKEQRDAIVEMEKQLSIIKAAEQKIAELSKTINPDLLKQVKSEAAPQPATPEVITEGFSR